MQIAILLFEKLTALDAVGPYEVLRSVPGWEVRFVGPQKGMVRTDNGALGLWTARPPRPSNVDTTEDER